MFYFYKKCLFVTFISIFGGCLIWQEAFTMAEAHQTRWVCRAPFVPLFFPQFSPERPLPNNCYFDTKINGSDYYQTCQLFYGEEISIREKNGILDIYGNDQKSGYVAKDQISAVPQQNNEDALKALVIHPLVQTYFSDTTKCNLILPMGSILHLNESDNPDFFQFFDHNWSKEKPLLIRKTNVISIDRLKEHDEQSLRTLIVEQAKKFIGKPYQWGGQTAVGIDCSGLIYTSYTASGQKITRNLLQIFDKEKTIETSRIQPGDLIFFYRTAYQNNIADHVILYEGDDFIIESSPQKGNVFRTTFEQEYGRPLASCNGEETFFLYGETYRIGCQSIIKK